MNTTIKRWIMTLILICGLSTLSSAAQRQMLLGMDAVTGPDDVKEEVLLPLYEKTAATAIIVQGKVRQIDVEQSAKNQPKSYTYDFSAFDSQPFMNSKKTKICRIGQDDYRLAKSANSRDEWSALESCMTALAQHANSKGITLFWVSRSIFEPTTRYVARLALIYKGIKAASPDNVVISKENSPTEKSIVDFYDAGGKGLFDILAIIMTAKSPETSVDTAALTLTHSIMEHYGDSDKKIFIGKWEVEGGGDITPAGVRKFVRAGHRILTTKTETYNPAWVAGAIYYPMNDYYATMQNLSHAPTPSDIHIRGGGLVDINGKPKEDLLEVIFSGKIK